MSAAVTAQEPIETWLELVRQKANAIRFGSVQITVHKGRVTQIESLEKTRFNAAVKHSLERPVRSA